MRHKTCRIHLYAGLDLLDTRWKQMHNAMRVREGTVTITGSHPHSRWSFCAQGHSILSQYQASYPAILDIVTYLSLNKLLGARAVEENPAGTPLRSAENGVTSHRREDSWCGARCCGLRQFYTRRKDTYGNGADASACRPGHTPPHPAQSGAHNKYHTITL